MTQPPPGRRPPSAPPPRRSSVPRPRRRLRRRPLLLGVLVVALVAGLVLVASWVRPTVDSGGSVTMPDARVGTAYAFDGVVCLGSGQLGATVAAGEVEQAPGGTTRLVAVPEGEPPTLGFPVADADGASLVGREVPAGEQDCLTRLVVVPDAEGSVQPGRVSVTYGYGPGGLLPRTSSRQPEVVLEVSGSGPDPRLAVD